MKHFLHLLRFDDVISVHAVVSVAAAVIPSVPLTAPLAGHTRDTPDDNTTTLLSDDVCD